MVPSHQPAIASWSLHPPQSVTLMHMCIQRSTSAQVTTVATTQRFRSKYVTIVIYKPRLPAAIVSADESQGGGSQPHGGYQQGGYQQGSYQGAACGSAPQSSTAAQGEPPSQGRAVSWSDEAGMSDVPPPPSQQMLNPHLMPPPPIPPQSLPAAFSSAPPAPAYSPGGGAAASFSGAESMDFGSRPSSQAAFMDTSGDHWG